MSQINVDTIKKADGTGSLSVPAESGTVVVKDGSNDVTLNNITATGVYLGGTVAANYLDDYEEGTWTPVDSSVGGLTFTVASAVYTKIGSWVNFNFAIAFPSTSNTADVKIGGLPFAVAQDSAGAMGYTNATVETEGVQVQDAFVYLIALNGNYRENVDYSGKLVRIMGGYQTTA